MSATTSILMYPEARTSLLQLGFDTNTKTLDDLIEEDIIKPYSTVIEFVSSGLEAEDADKAIRQDIANKLNMPIYKDASYFLVIFRSYQVYSFHVYPFSSLPPQRLHYTLANGGSWIDSYPLDGLYTANLQSKKYVGCTLRISGNVKSLRIGGYTDQVMKVNEEYTIAKWHSDEVKLCAPISTNVLSIQYLNSSLQYAGVVEINQTGIIVSPRGKDIPADTSLLNVFTYI